MNNMKMCPMMNNMLMQQAVNPMHTQPMANIASANNAPMMNAVSPEMAYLEEDERDENIFEEMYPDICKKILPHVDRVLDTMEEKDEMFLENIPDNKVLRAATDEAFDNMMKDMPELMHGNNDSRQYGPRAALRDVFGLLLLNQLGGRRRRRRRFRPPYYGYGYGSPFSYGDYYYWD